MSKHSMQGVSVGKELTQKLYSIPPGSIGSIKLPGPDAASAKMLVEKLLHNQEHFHTYFNDKGFHKCIFSIP
ncbi:hypothetical protein EWM64_g10036 [Hericium alpestre]|uniref:Uncharacterized protein n=1 Tax=Hericium alpestre TaxID=135208 RepID=A0A4Y9ZGU4_9AGAM|nr:hypothetical protein EWM64_g10036 [Hericium alpestre]